MKTTIQLLVNGEERDFFQFFQEVVKSVGLCAPASPESLPTSTLQPNVLYRVSDPIVLNALGISAKVANPGKSVVYMLKKAKIDVLAQRKRGSFVFGRQITEYYKSQNKKSFTQKN